MESFLAALHVCKPGVFSSWVLGEASLTRCTCGDDLDAKLTDTRSSWFPIGGQAGGTSRSRCSIGMQVAPEIVEETITFEIIRIWCLGGPL
jgi:hypothetical protein